VAGVSATTVSLPRLIGGEGILDTFPLSLSKDEQESLHRSAAIVGEAIQSLS
jgi:L-lactate dehydrogenase